MHLAKITLDPHYPQARRDTSNAYELHRTLCRAFAADESTTPSRFLWRMEYTRPPVGLIKATVLVQSALQGNWQPLEGIDGYQLDGHKCIDLGELLATGRRYRFRLSANPTVTRAGKRYGLVGEEAQLDWLARQGQRLGFNNCGAVVDGCERIGVKQRKTNRWITLDVVHFEGVLEATNAEALGRALVDGIGHGKALGLGMLSLAPLPLTQRRSTAKDN